MSDTKARLDLLNDYRAEEGLAPYKDWRATRHQPQLDKYVEAYKAKLAKQGADEEQARADAELAERKRIEQENADRIAAEERALEEQASKGKGRAKARKLSDGEKQITDAINSGDFAGIGDKFKGTKLPSYKEMANYSDSTVEKPVAFTHQFLSDNRMLSRKEAIAALMRYGVNYSTARTQYQRWFTENKKPKA